jgi:heme/copper-type cytochrome/quinol oxidase subunit 4
MNFKKIAFIVLCAALCLVPLFFNAYRFDLPVGYGGMFASFGEQLADENFALPVTAMGGIPYVYPPLGFYAHAIFLKLGISTWFYLRWLIPFYSLAALIAFSVVYEHFFRSKVWAVLAALLIASAPYLVESHIWAAGMVRGLAFGLFLFALAIFLRLKPDSDWKWAALAGIFSGLTILSHLGYAFFLALWMGIWFLFHLKLWKQVPVVVGFALLTVAPWLVAVLAHHSVDVFLNALRSHNTLDIFSVLGSAQGMFSLLSIGLSKLFEIPLLGWLALAGAGVQIYRRRLELPLMLAVTILFHLQSRRFVVVLGIILAVGLLQEITRFFSDKRFMKIPALVLTGFLVLAMFTSGMARVVAAKPSLTAPLLDVAQYLRDNSTPESGYHILADYNETEWFPYLSRRIPIIPWAREWDGNLGEQAGMLLESFSCGQAGDVACVEQIIRDSGKDPEYLVVMKRKYFQFLDAISESGNWRRVYNNPEYQVWEKRK